MAKRKTPKAEKIINLAPKPEKITDEQLNKLQSTVKTIDHITVDIGNTVKTVETATKTTNGVNV